MKNFVSLSLTQNRKSGKNEVSEDIVAEIKKREELESTVTVVQ